jgi:uncharacterized protein
MQQPKFLFLAGYGNSTGEHWQAKWFSQHADSIWVEQDWDQPRRDDWVNAIHSTLEKNSEPLVVISHSLGGLAFIEWANQYPDLLREKIRGAFLVALPDADAKSFPAAIQGFAHTPFNKIPVPTLMLVSQNDPYARFERSCFFASALASELISLGNKGHINSTAGLGDWPEGEKYLQAFVNSLR